MGDFYRSRSKTFFIPAKENPKFFTYQKIRCYHPLSFFILLLLTPALKLGRFFDQRLMHPTRKKWKGTPNQTSALVISQIIGNIKELEALAENNGAQYLFTLQPSLMYTGPVTQDDKVFYESRNRTKLWGFRWGDFVKTYYSQLIRTFKRDEKLKNNFLDLSAIFLNDKDQNFVDTMHMGNLGQEKCAKVLSEAIWDKVNPTR